MSAELLEKEIAETQTLLTAATFEGIRSALAAHVQKLQRHLQQIQTSAAAAAETQASSVAQSKTSSRSTASSSPQFISIENFAWDQGEYNSPTVTVYAELDQVGTVKDSVSVSFSKHGFDLQILGLNDRNYRLLKDNLEKEIVPHESSFIVKKNKVVIKLKKVKGEFSYDHWASLTAKKRQDASGSDAKKDPMGGIMDMMKNLYEEGDDQTKKMIGEAMMKSQRGEQPSMPSL